MGWIKNFKEMRQFDYSMSYNPQADFFHPMWVYENYTELVLTDPSTRFEDKTGNIMYLASNCESHNDRESYVRALMKHFNPISTSFQPHFNTILTPFEPHLNPVFTPF
jgi:hypothetical protein